MIKNFWLLIGIFAGVLIFSGCAAIKNARDAKAVGRVMSSTDLSNQVFARLVVEHPCPPSQIEYIPGKTVTIIDSVVSPLNLDSILVRNCPTLNIDSIKQLFRRNPVVITVTHNTVDTIKVPDPRALQMANDSLNNVRGQREVLKSQLATSQKSDTKKTWWIVGISVLSIAVIIGLIYLLFRK